jgi:hypothetical protein
MPNDTVTTTDKAGASSAEQHPITADDIVLEPDATMLQHAQAANAGLLKNFPKGYPLGDQHAPNISVIGGYFHTEKPSALSSMRCRLANVPLPANYPPARLPRTCHN